MNIDNSMIKSYLSDNEDYKSHWLFNSILDSGEYTFDKPSSLYKDKVEEIYEEICSNLKCFTPYNVEIFSGLFPKWRDLIKDVNIILTVGCPSPYDAMVREHMGKEYIIFDLIRFLEYEQAGYDIVTVIIGMITHEFAHVCIHSDYPNCKDEYISKLTYITFDEGFAHILAFKDNIAEHDFGNFVDVHYRESLTKLKEALIEEDTVKQEQYIEESNSGDYWSKFAAISGKLYLALNLDRLEEIYKEGPSAFISNIISTEI